MPDKITVGSVEIISLLDTPMQLPWSIVFPSVPRAEIDAFRDVYPDSHGDVALRTQAGCYAARSQGKTVLVDTGIGPGPIAMLGGIRGALLADMRKKGLEPESVDIVIHTHLHGDHVGWNLASGKPNFPNARYYAPAADFEFFSKALDSNPQMQQVVPLKDLGRLELYSGEISLTSELTTYPTPGHTPGHSSVLISSGSEKAMIMGDVCHFPAQLEMTDWLVGFDTDREQAVETRRKVAGLLETQGVIAGFCHFPAPGLGRIVRLEGRRAWQAL